MKNRMIFFTKPLVILAMVSGCSATPEYPANWARKPQVEGCPDVSGDYLDIAKGDNYHSPFEQHGNPESFVYSLNSMVILGRRNTNEDVDFVRISQTETELNVEAYKDNELLRKKTVRYTGNGCIDGFLTMKVPKPEAGEFVLGIQNDVYGLSKADDGALIVRYESSGIGIYFIPIAATQWIWYRFPTKPMVDDGS